MSLAKENNQVLVPRHTSKDRRPFRNQPITKCHHIWHMVYIRHQQYLEFPIQVLRSHNPQFHHRAQIQNQEYIKVLHTLIVHKVLVPYRWMELGGLDPVIVMVSQIGPTLSVGEAWEKKCSTRDIDH